MSSLEIPLILFAVSALGLLRLYRYWRDRTPFVPLSVNFHMTRKCNYSCGFCFHTDNKSQPAPLEDAKRVILQLKAAGMKKLNFSGGEPFLYRGLGELVRFSKEEAKLDSVTIVSNGSLITEQWFDKYGQWLDILAISCDSFNPETNRTIGRQKTDKDRDHVIRLKRISSWCDKFSVMFKVNTVVNTHNVEEDMSTEMSFLKPVRWKLFQCLLIDNENNKGATPDAVRDARPFVVTKDAFDNFVTRHRKAAPSLNIVPEDNTTMKDSYLIMDEKLRFLNCTSGSKVPGKPILQVGLAVALAEAGFDQKSFTKRDGDYSDMWSRSNNKDNKNKAKTTICDVEDLF
eukprot:TRINITY_DN66386_c0_g1_i2.p1 TRINITY_DN66386_c0_g1~~TRINITY_DN66386_c0_g1_i2.p1  ORF type:complete len:344 (-),score=52.81 TRINITY_DN66386_c0_g1_i2:157-1188(-)